jgi:hypothetical protein
MNLKRMTFRAALLIGIATLLIFAGCALAGSQADGSNGVASRATTISSNSTGTDKDGFYYSFWKQDNTGTVTMTIDTGTTGNYTTSWTGCSNFTAGKGWPTGTADRVITYSGSFNGGSNGYLAIYGWMESPLVEYYIIENHGSWTPPGSSATHKGTVTSDGGTYDIYTATRTNAPNITGTNQNFTQYWSVRQTTRSSGTVTVANHFNAWKNLGMTLGTFASRDYQIVETEGYQSSGSSNITVGSGSPSKSWTGFVTGMDAWVDTLAFDPSGTLYAGGWFTKASDNTVNYVAKLNGNSWSAVGSGLPNFVNSIAIDGNGTVYAEYLKNGTGSSMPIVVKWTGSTWQDLGFPGSNYTEVTTLACDSNNNLYAGGYKGIFVWNGSSWTDISAGITYVNSIVFDNSGNLYAGCSIDFQDSNGTWANHIAKWNISTKKWTALGAGTDDYVLAVAYDAKTGTLYAGGLFKTAGDAPANYVAKWNGSTWSALGTGMDGYVQTLACDSAGNLYAGGMFATAGGVTVNHVAMWDGSTWSALGAGVNSGVDALAFDKSGNLWAGGSFTTAVGNYIAEWK